MRREWVKQIKGFPLAFAQVREDALIDLKLVAILPPHARVMLVASGGCTAAALAGADVTYLHLVDPNPSQIALSRLKLQLLKMTDLEERLALLGHIRMGSKKRGTQLENLLTKLGLPLNSLGTSSLISRIGPDYSGRYEMVFAKFREELIDYTKEIESLLSLTCPTEQQGQVVRSTKLGKAIDKAFERTMELHALQELFGPNATANRMQDFSQHFAWRTRNVLASLPAISNPYLAQVFLGHFLEGTYTPWLNTPKTRKLPDIKCSIMDMVDALETERPASLDLVHLSNILDWLTPSEASRVLRNAWNSLRYGGYVLIRQLNSTLNIRAISTTFSWDAHLSQTWHKQDRSFFYRALHVGQKV